MRPYFMCKPRHCRQEMKSGYKKNVVVTSFMLWEFSKLILSTQSRGHHRVNIVDAKHFFFFLFIMLYMRHSSVLNLMIFPSIKNIIFERPCHYFKQL